MKQPFALSLSCLLGGLLVAAPALAQQVQSVSLDAVPPDLIEADAPVAAPMQPVDLGQDLGASETVLGAGGTPTPSLGTAARAAQAARPAAGDSRTRRPPASQAQARAGVERAVFERQPVRVPLPVGHERLITLPAPAALHVPTDMASVARLEVIDRTIYATALVPFTPIRIVAELIDSGQQIPMDLVAEAGTASARAELEVFVVEPGRGVAQTAETAAGAAEASGDAAPAEQPAVDMIELTRHAARQLYAPRRLAWTTPGVQRMDVVAAPIEGLIRGVDVEAAPLGQWRAGRLYVTAVRITSRRAGWPIESEWSSRSS